MYYELYADSLWLLNFVMNLYLLILVDRSSLRTATRMRIVLSAAVGAVLYLLPFFWEAPVWIKYLTGVTTGTSAMALIAFRPGSLRAFFHVLERMFLFSFLTGGALLFLTEAFPILQESILTVCGILGAGAVLFGLTLYLLDAERRKRQRSSCSATLFRNGREIRVDALLDSGNSLREPISGKPVSVIGESLYRGLWQDEEALYRAVPYRSVGRSRGILRAYLLPELQIEVDGMVKRFQDVYLAVSGEYAGDREMILNPELLAGSQKGIKNKVYKELEMRNGYDIKSDNTWENTAENDPPGKDHAAQTGGDPLHRRGGSAAGTAGRREGKRGHRGSGNGG